MTDQQRARLRELKALWEPLDKEVIKITKQLYAAASVNTPSMQCFVDAMAEFCGIGLVVVERAFMLSQIQYNPKPGKKVKEPNPAKVDRLRELKAALAPLEAEANRISAELKSFAEAEGAQALEAFRRDMFEFESVGKVSVDITMAAMRLNELRDLEVVV